MSTLSDTDVTTSPAIKLAELIKEVQVALLITGDPGDLHARPMFTQRVDPDTFDGTLYFFAEPDSRKIHEIRDNQDVMLTLADPAKHRYIVVRGQAQAERDPAKARELWSIHAKGWWPEGPDSDRLSVIRVQVRDAEYWDGPSNTRYLLSLAKARLTGERVAATGDHERVRLG